MASRIDKRGSFKAFDGTGREHVIYKTTEVLIIGPMGQPGSELDNISYLKTANGRTVNRKEKGKYVFLDDGTELTSNDPNAS